MYLIEEPKFSIYPNSALNVKISQLKGNLMKELVNFQVKSTTNYFYNKINVEITFTYINQSIRLILKNFLKQGNGHIGPAVINTEQ